MAEQVPVTQARDELAELINRVAYGHERIILTRHRKTVAALVPPEDLSWLEQRSQERINLTSAGLALEAQSPASTEALPIAARHTEGRPPGRPSPGPH